jgi:hypothetical protein
LVFEKQERKFLETSFKLILSLGFEKNGRSTFEFERE